MTEIEAKNLKESHDVMELFSILNRIVPQSGLHKFEGLSSIRSLLLNFEKYGVTSESSRYITDKNGKTLKLYSKQIYLLPVELHEIVESCWERMQKYINSFEFDACESKIIRKKRVTELKRAAQALMRHKEIFEPFNRKKRLPIETEFKSVAQRIKEMDKNSDAVLIRKLHEALSVLKETELSFLTYGLYLTRGLSQVEPFEYFNEWGRESKILKIIERRREYQESLRIIPQHIRWIESHLKA